MRAVVLALALLGVVLTGCGDDAPVPETTRIGGAKTVATSMLVALAENDLATARRLMTQSAWSIFEREMQAFQAELGGRGFGPALREKVDAVLGDGAEAALARAQRGSTREVWAFIQSVWPLANPPRFAGLRAEHNRPNEEQWLFLGHQNDVRRITLAWLSGRWRVKDIQLP